MAQVILVYPDSLPKAQILDRHLPISLLLLGTPLERTGFEVVLLDIRMTENWQGELKRHIGPETICVGISAMTTQVDGGIEVAQAVRRIQPALPLVWGGIHVSIAMSQSIQSPYVDYIVVGEGEFVFLELVRALEAGADVSKIKGIAHKREGRSEFTGPADLSPGIDHYFDLSYRLIGDVRKYLRPAFGSDNPCLPVFTSRGCPFNCNYCYHCAMKHYKKWRKGSIPRMFEHFSWLSATYGVENFYVWDDNFFVNKNHSLGFARRVIEGKNLMKFYNMNLRADNAAKYSVDEMKVFHEAGMDYFFVGAESGSDRVLKLMNKGYTKEAILNCSRLLKKAGITGSYSFIISYPEETADDTKETLRLMDQVLRENPDSYIFYNVFFPHPGTPAHKRCVELGMKPINRFEGWARYLEQRDLFNELIGKKHRKLLRRVEANVFPLARNHQAGGQTGEFNAVRLINRLLIAVFRLRARYKFYHFMFLTDLKRYVVKKKNPVWRYRT